jgi:hypothetical protein
MFHSNTVSQWTNVVSPEATHTVEHPPISLRQAEDSVQSGLWVPRPLRQYPPHPSG